MLILSVLLLFHFLFHILKLADLPHIKPRVFAHRVNAYVSTVVAVTFYNIGKTYRCVVRQGFDNLRLNDVASGIRKERHAGFLFHRVYLPAVFYMDYAVWNLKVLKRTDHCDYVLVLFMIMVDVGKILLYQNVAVSQYERVVYAAFEQAEAAARPEWLFFIYIIDVVITFYLVEVRLYHIFLMIDDKIEILTAILSELVDDMFGYREVSDRNQWLWQYFRIWIEPRPFAAGHHNDREGDLLFRISLVFLIPYKYIYYMQLIVYDRYRLDRFFTHELKRAVTLPAVQIAWAVVGNIFDGCV